MAEGNDYKKEEKEELEDREFTYYSDEDDDDVPPPTGFKGKLTEGDKWVKCPYFDHPYLLSKSASHLSKCSNNAKGMDIAICRYNISHRRPSSKIEQHEEKCRAQQTMYVYLDYYIERQRLSKRKSQQRNLKMEEDDAELNPTAETGSEPELTAEQKLTAEAELTPEPQLGLTTERKLIIPEPELSQDPDLLLEPLLRL